jgi:hypothetical protein
MNTSLYSVTVPVFRKGLAALSAILDKAEMHLKDAGKSEAELLAKRFAPDMFPLTKQVQVACDQAKGFAFRLKGEQPPAIEDTETTIAELKARIQKTIDILDTVKPEDVDAKEGSEVRLPYFPNMHLTGFHYAFEYVIPNFFFHLTTAYDLLREEGVTIGKADYIGGLSFRQDA